MIGVGVFMKTLFSFTIRVGAVVIIASPMQGSTLLPHVLLLVSAAVVLFCEYKY